MRREVVEGGGDGWPEGLVVERGRIVYRTETAVTEVRGDSLQAVVVRLLELGGALTKHKAVIERTFHG